MPYEDIRTFNATATLTRSSGRKSHHITVGTLKGSHVTWVCKVFATAQSSHQRLSSVQQDKAEREVLAQEFFRLIIPHQPQTRIAYHPYSSDYFILSERIAGYQKLPHHQQQCFEDGTYTGLGQALVCAAFVQEIDLKNGNLGLDHQQRVIKIDGDQSFASFLPEHAKQCPMEDDWLSSLPYPTHFYVFNWLDYVKQTERHRSSRLVHSGLRQSIQFQQEVSLACFSIVLLSNETIERLVHGCILESPRAERFISLLQSRRDRLQQLATNYPFFQTYLSNIQSVDDVQSLLSHRLSFNVQGRFPITLNATDRTKLTQYTIDRLIDAALLIPSIEPFELERSRLALHRMNASRLQETDPLLDAFIIKSLHQIRHNALDTAALSTINAELETMQQAICSPEVPVLHRTIEQLAKKYGGQTKASETLRALRSLPLINRRDVISSNEANPVQQTLATHRFFPWPGKLYLKNNGHEIDERNAADTFKQLKQQHRQTNLFNPPATTEGLKQSDGV